MNVGNGEKSWYRYDIKEGTLQRFTKEETVKETSKSKDIYLVLAIVFAIIAGMAILIVLLLMLMNNKLKKKNEKLISKIKDKKVKIVEHPVFDVEVDESKSWKNMVEPEDNGVDDATFFARDDSDIMTKINEEVEIKSFDEEKKEEKTKLTKEEKEVEKAKKKEEEAELKAMRDDFLKTRELEITKELKMPTSKKKAKKKKKK